MKLILTKRPRNFCGNAVKYPIINIIPLLIALLLSVHILSSLCCCLFDAIVRLNDDGDVGDDGDDDDDFYSLSL